MIKRRLSVAIALVSIAGFTSADASSNNTEYTNTELANTSTTKAIPQITTTASRTPIAIEDTGSAISVIGRERIVASNATTVAELLRSLPGLHVNQQGPRGAVTQLRIRGAEANQVLVLIDGVEANDIAQGGEFNFAHLGAQDVQRIEVLRGPQSALWGSDALAGVINIITRSNQKPGTSFNASVEAGAFDSTQASASFAAASEQTQFQLFARQIDTDGTNVSRVGREDDGYENTSVGFILDHAVSDNLLISSNFRNTLSETDFDGTDFVTTGLPVDAGHVTESEQFYARVGARLTSLNGQLEQRLSFGRTDTENENDTGNPVTDDTESTLDQWQYQANVYLGDHTLSLVADHESINYVQRGPVGFGDPNKRLNTKTLGAAIEYRFASERWDLSASARQEDNDDFDDAHSYRLTAAWQTGIQSLNLFATYGRAVKNPTFTERFGFFTSFQGNPELEPEHSIGWEIGARVSSDDNRWRTSLSYFDSNLDNEINGFVFDPVSGNFTAANIDGESERSGFEFEQELQLSDHVFLHGSYTYIDSYSEDASGREVDEVRRPKHTASLSGSYQWENAGLYVGVNYNGEQRDNYFPPFPAPQELVTLDRYTLVNIAGHYAFSEHLTLTARVENALDEDYEEVFGYATPGLAAYAGIKLAW